MTYLELILYLQAEMAALAPPEQEPVAVVDEVIHAAWSAGFIEGEKAALAQPEQEPDRRALQAAGTHPAPCARHCEAKAFEIEIRSLNSRLKQTLPMKAADEFELHRLLAEERYTVRQLSRALREQVESPTFMGEPLITHTTPPAAQPKQRKPLTANEILNLMPSSIPAEYDGALMEFARAVEAKLKERKIGVTTHCQCEACKNGNIHDSDCSVHNGDALPVGPCDCSLATLPVQPAESAQTFYQPAATEAIKILKSLGYVYEPTYTGLAWVAKKPEQQAEPVAWRVWSPDGTNVYQYTEDGDGEPLYTTPPAAQPDYEFDYKLAFNEWLDKTEWVQEKINSGHLGVRYLGMHRADVLRDLAYPNTVTGKAPQQRPWVGLTDEDWAKVGDMPDTFDQGVAWAAARLKERNNG
jgi:hypothetical protein